MFSLVLDIFYLPLQSSVREALFFLQKANTTERGSDSRITQPTARHHYQSREATVATFCRTVPNVITWKTKQNKPIYFPLKVWNSDPLSEHSFYSSSITFLASHFYSHLNYIVLRNTIKHFICSFIQILAVDSWKYFPASIKLEFKSNSYNNSHF